MAEADIHRQVETRLEGLEVDAKTLDALASQLVWRVGRLTDDGPITVRVGLASSVPLFADLPRLKTASDSELQTAVNEGDFRIEWVGRLPVQ